MVDGIEGAHAPEANKLFHREISEREMRAEVLDQWANKLKTAADTLRKESATAFHPDQRHSEHGHHFDGKPVKRGIGLLDPRVDIRLEDSAVLGFHLSLDEIEAFAENPMEFVAVVNRHCVIYDHRLSPDSKPIR